MSQTKNDSFLKRLARPRQSFHFSEITLTYLGKITRLLSKRREYILIACMPRTASTFMTAVLSELTGYTNTSLEHGRHLYLPKLIDTYNYGTVTQLHLKANRQNLSLIKAFSIRPVILTRNIFDIVVSIRDFLYQESFSRFITFFCNEKYSELDEKTQYDFIIELGLPWYFHFFVSWYEACASKGIEALWLAYEDSVADWNTALRKITSFYRIDKSDKEIEDALQRTLENGRRKILLTRLNKGVSGRGRAALTLEQQEKIIGYARFYPWVDFTKIGIPKSTIG
jgi:hypothetical protein